MTTRLFRSRGCAGWVARTQRRGERLDDEWDICRGVTRMADKPLLRIVHRCVDALRARDEEGTMHQLFQATIREDRAPMGGLCRAIQEALKKKD